MNPGHRPIVRLYFRFYGDEFDPAEITKRLGIKPTTEFRPGDPSTKDGRGRRSKPGWFIKAGDRETVFIDEMLQELQERVDVSGAAVRELCDDLNVEAVIVCGVRLGRAEIAPALSFTTEFLEWATEMGASINVDVVF